MKKLDQKRRKYCLGNCELQSLWWTSILDQFEFQLNTLASKLAIQSEKVMKEWDWSAERGGTLTASGIFIFEHCLHVADKHVPILATKHELPNMLSKNHFD